MKRIFLLAVLAVLASTAPADAGPIRDRLAKAFRPAPKAVVVTAAPAAKAMPKTTGGKVPTCCCQDCQCNKAPAAKK